MTEEFEFLHLSVCLSVLPQVWEAVGVERRMRSG